MQNQNKYVAYYRVSTNRQGKSGLGMQAQKRAVQDFINQFGGVVITEYKEVESGKNSNRPELNKAIDYVQLSNAKLLVAKLDRLSRDLHFLTNLMKQNIAFRICDMPLVDELTINVIGATAQHELRMISTRTKAALLSAKERGVTLGNPVLDVVRNRDVSAANKARTLAQSEWRKKILRVISHVEKQGHETCLSIAQELNRRGLKTYRNCEFTVPVISRLRRYSDAD